MATLGWKRRAWNTGPVEAKNGGYWHKKRKLAKETLCYLCVFVGVLPTLFGAIAVFFGSVWKNFVKYRNPWKVWTVFGGRGLFSRANWIVFHSDPFLRFIDVGYPGKA